MAKSELGKLPEEMVCEIQSRLGVKSLLRFRCVSKTWCETISHPKFALSARNKRVALMFGRRRTLHMVNEAEEKLASTPWIDNDLDTFLDSISMLDQHLNLCRRQVMIRLLASYKGLLLLSRGEDIFLLNPSTRHCRNVLTNRLLNDSDVDWNDFRVSAGICFDPSTEDYKVVLQIEVGWTPGYGLLLVEAAYFKTKIWKEIQFPYGRHWDSDGPVVDEKIHWLARKDKKYDFYRHDLIIYFDAVNDKFMEVPIPEHPKYGNESCILCLGVLDECLAMTRCQNQTSSDEWLIDVWVMKEYGIKESWTILFTVETKDDPRWVNWKPLLVTTYGDVLMRIDHNRIMSYNPKKDSYKDVLLPKKLDFIKYVVTYEESLFFPFPNGVTKRKKRHGRRRGKKTVEQTTIKE